QTRDARCCILGPASRALYALSLHDALPICAGGDLERAVDVAGRGGEGRDVDEQEPAPRRIDGDLRARRDGLFAERGIAELRGGQDRKSTRLNSSHLVISYAVFCLKKKKHTYRLPHLNANNFCQPPSPLSLSFLLKFLFQALPYLAHIDTLDEQPTAPIRY